MFALRSRDGFALPMTILVIGFMTAGVIAAFARTSSEVQLVDNERGQLGAFTIAEAGLQQFLATSTGTPAATRVFKYGARDSAIVTATLMRPAVGTDPAIWLIRSEGVLGTPAVGRPLASRTVAQFAYRVTGTMQVLSSWTSLSGISKQGSSGTITGVNACNNSEVTAGVAVPQGGYSYTGGSTNPVTGNPAISEMGNQTQMAGQIKIDWPGIVDPVNPSITPDRIVCNAGTPGYNADMGPCGSYPGSFAADAWPVIVINGSATLQSGHSGRGTLIVLGNLDFLGTMNWDGIVMVGGKITDHGTGQISGAVVSGLNVLLGDPVTESSKADGTKDYSYDSCKVEKAASAQSRLIQLTNAWVDNWTNW